MAREDDLDELFATARAARAVPSDDLMARVLADAMALQPRPAAAPTTAVEAGWLARVADWFGGLGGLAGVGGAAAAGVFLGFVQPAPVTDIADALWGGSVATVELIPSADALITGSE